MATNPVTPRPRHRKPPSAPPDASPLDVLLRRLATGGGSLAGVAGDLLRRGERAEGVVAEALRAHQAPHPQASADGHHLIAAESEEGDR